MGATAGQTPGSNGPSEGYREPQQKEGLSCVVVAKGDPGAARQQLSHSDLTQ